LGGVSLDHLIYDREAQLLNASLADYLLPLATDFPNVRGMTLELRPPPPIRSERKVPRRAVSWRLPRAGSKMRARNADKATGRKREGAQAAEESERINGQ
jgi:hypothetical protein